MSDHQLSHCPSSDLFEITLPLILHEWVKRSPELQKSASVMSGMATDGRECLSAHFVSATLRSVSPAYGMHVLSLTKFIHPGGSQWQCPIHNVFATAIAARRTSDDQSQDKATTGSISRIAHFGNQSRDPNAMIIVVT